MILPGAPMLIAGGVLPPELVSLRFFPKNIEDHDNAYYATDTGDMAAQPGDLFVALFFGSMAGQWTDLGYGRHVGGEVTARCSWMIATGTTVSNTFSTTEQHLPQYLAVLRFRRCNRIAMIHDGTLANPLYAPPVDTPPLDVTTINNVNDPVSFGGRGRVNNPGTPPGGAGKPKLWLSIGIAGRNNPSPVSGPPTGYTGYVFDKGGFQYLAKAERVSAANAEDPPAFPNMGGSQDPYLPITMAVWKDDN